MASTIRNIALSISLMAKYSIETGGKKAIDVTPDLFSTYTPADTLSRNRPDKRFSSPMQDFDLDVLARRSPKGLVFSVRIAAALQMDVAGINPFHEAQKKKAVTHVVDQRLCSEHRACRSLYVHRSSQRVIRPNRRAGDMSNYRSALPLYSGSIQAMVIAGSVPYWCGKSDPSAVSRSRTFGAKRV